MNKAELVTQVAESMGISNKQADKTVTAIFDVILKSLVAGEKVHLLGFGTLKVKKCSVHRGRNFATGEPMEVAATKQMVFTASKSLKAAVKYSTRSS